MWLPDYITSTYVGNFDDRKYIFESLFNLKELTDEFEGILNQIIFILLWWPIFYGIKTMQNHKRDI